MLTLAFNAFLLLLSVSSFLWRGIYFTILPAAWVVHVVYASALTLQGESPVISAVIWVCGLLWLLIWQRDKDKDDRWKKWRKKLTEKIAVTLDGRLSTVDA